ncbi:pyridoxamine 5'-phosphate oxidase family protein [uncultured Kriegella sp.]|uniref:pyridoxamine 5'-phosphate oxidase family protein n=1 Tax=uncultured Kriegella sp. TaxID=1798910 RepID=UPI0030DB08AF|tara:strand:- start:51643 stop:52098 length:456 start_codon:yes stop_codon:yes gene_type:complete
MRRNLEEKESIELLKNSYIGSLAYIMGATPYIVPITYYYDSANHTITGYSAIGHKLDAMRKNPSVALGVNLIDSVANWQSVQVHGTFEELEGIDAKQTLHEFSVGVKGILNHNKKNKARFISEFSAKIESEAPPVVFRIKIGDIVGKLRKN